MAPDEIDYTDDGDPDDAYDALDQPLIIDDTVHDLAAAMDAVTDKTSARSFYDALAGDPT